MEKIRALYFYKKKMVGEQRNQKKEYNFLFALWKINICIIFKKTKLRHKKNLNRPP